MARTPAELPVAVFDSGVGGLTVLHELLVALPHEDFVYLGDTARFPYGERTPRAARVRARDRRAPARRPARSCSSSPATPRARRRSTRSRSTWTRSAVDVIGVIDAGHAARGRRPAATAGSGCSRRRRRSPAAPTSARSARPTRTSTCESVACPDLAPIIQRGFPFDDELVETVRGYCAPLREAGVDTVILGCTHYPLIAPMLQRMLGPRRDAGHLGRGGRAQRRAGAERARGLLQPARRTRATTASSAPATSRPSARSARASCRCRSGRSSTSSSAPGWPHERGRGRASAATAAAPISCGRRRSSPASCARPPARR